MCPLILKRTEFQYISPLDPMLNFEPQGLGPYTTWDIYIPVCHLESAYYNDDYCDTKKKYFY
jgi:hypothetical protein